MVALCTFTMILIAVFGYFSSPSEHCTAVVFTFCSIFWLLVALDLTSEYGSFHVTGNGYFSIWGGFLLCIKVVTSATASASSELDPLSIYLPSRVQPQSNFISSETSDTTSTHTGSTSGGVGGHSAVVNDRLFPYFLIISAAIVLIVTRGFSGVGMVSLTLGIFGVYITFCKPELQSAGRRRLPMVGIVTYGTGLPLALLIWSSFWAFILTFVGPFTVTGNGYFASWGLVVGSVLAVRSTLDMETIRNHSIYIFWNSSPSRGWSCILFAVTVIQLCSAIAADRGDAILSVIICILTVLLTVTFVYFPSIFERYMAVVFSCWSILWLIVAFILTSTYGSFPVTGNGYFSVWGRFLLCIKVATSARASSSSVTQQ